MSGAARLVKSHGGRLALVNACLWAVSVLVGASSQVTRCDYDGENLRKSRERITSVLVGE